MCSKLESNHLQFILAGNATFTVLNPGTGCRFTFKVQKSEPSEKYPEQVWFCSLLNGPDNWTNYIFFGVLKDNGVKFIHSNRKGISDKAKSNVAFVWTLNRLVNNLSLNGVEIWHEGKCGRCGRKLTVPESIASGFGPECAGKL